jgi:hypothetical protein
MLKACTCASFHPPRPLPAVNPSKQNEREIHLTNHTNATHLLATYPTQPYDTTGALTTNILTFFPRWLPLVVIFPVSRETLFGMNFINNISPVWDRRSTRVAQG